MKDLIEAEAKLENIIFKLHEQAAFLKICLFSDIGVLEEEELHFIFTIAETLRVGMMDLATETQACLFDLGKQVSSLSGEADCTIGDTAERRTVETTDGDSSLLNDLKVMVAELFADAERIESIEEANPAMAAGNRAFAAATHRISGKLQRLLEQKQRPDAMKTACNIAN